MNLNKQIKEFLSAGGTLLGDAHIGRTGPAEIKHLFPLNQKREYLNYLLNITK